MNNVLVKSKKYNGRYVALKSFGDNTVVGSGKDPQTALKEAAKNGVKDPALVYVPEKKMAHIY